MSEVTEERSKCLDKSEEAKQRSEMQETGGGEQQTGTYWSLAADSISK